MFPIGTYLGSMERSEMIQKLPEFLLRGHLADEAIQDHSMAQVYRLPQVRSLLENSLDTRGPSDKLFCPIEQPITTGRSSSRAPQTVNDRLVTLSGEFIV